jgi:WD40 repeat protein
MSGMELEMEWKGHAHIVSSLQFSLNGQWILSSSHDHTVKVWDSNTGVLVSAFTGHIFDVTGAVFLPSTMYIISASYDETVRFWEVHANGMGLSADESFSRRRIAVYSPDGRYLISEGHSGTIQQYDADTGEPGQALCHESKVRCAAYSPTRLLIATGNSEGMVMLWNTQTGIVEHILCGHFSSVDVVAYSPCGQWIASGGETQAARVWDAYSGTATHTFDKCLGVFSLAFSPDGLDLAVGCLSDVIVHDLSTGECKTAIQWGFLSLPIVSYLPGISRVACSYARIGIRLYDGDGKSFWSVLDHDSTLVQGFAFSFCGRWIATYHTRSIQLWKRVSHEAEPKWRLGATVKDIFTGVTAIAWRPNTTEFATVCQDGSFRAWKVVEEEEESGGVSIQLL